MSIGSAFGPLTMVSGPLDFSGKSLNRLEKDTLDAVALLQKESNQMSYSRYEIIKHNGTNDDVAFLDGITKVKNIEDYMQGLINRAEKNGGEDSFGVHAKDYARVAEAKGILVDYKV